MIDTSRMATEKILRGELVNWTRVMELTSNYLIEYAKANPEVEIIFKGKRNWHTEKNLPKEFPENCKFVLTNPGHKELKHAKVVVSFNSTIMIEAILANRSVIIPSFEVDRVKFKSLIYKSPDLYTNTKKDFFEKLNQKLNEEHQKKDLDNDEKDCVDYYLGNADGKSGLRLKNFLQKNII